MTKSTKIEGKKVASKPKALSGKLASSKKAGKRKWPDVPDIYDSPVRRPDPYGISEAMKAEIRSIVREELQASSQPPVAQLELPPLIDTDKKVLSERGHKMAPAKRPKIAGTVDAELLRLFEDWRKERGISLSRALDTALWHLLGKPKLSFEK
jgi:hypothetical protein